MDQEKLLNNPKEVRNFGIVLGLILGFIGWLQWRHDHMMAVKILWSLAILAELAAFLMPKLLKPTMKGFLKLAMVLGWINTRLLLILIFYLIFMPIGLIMRLFGKDFLNRKIDKKADTYWVPYDTKPLGNKHYERQF